MKSIAWHLDNARAKSHHVRRQIAFSTAGLVTGFIAIVWLGISLYTGAFALNKKSGEFAQDQSAPAASGAAAPAPSEEAAVAAPISAPTGQPQIQVVPASDGSTSATPPAPQDSTVIPF